MASSAAPLVRACKPTDPAEAGHAVVILHYTDKTTNIRTFFMAEESSYIERVQVNSTGAVVMNSTGRKPKQERFRRFPAAVVTNAGRRAHIAANRNYVASPLSHFVFRKNAARGNMKYTLQVPNGIWGFPKGSGNSPQESSKDIAAREFLEETGYVLDTNRLVFKKCVDIEYYDSTQRKKQTRQSVVFHYELRNTDDSEKNALLSAFTQKNASREGELFHANFFTEAEVNRKRTTNEISKLAFAGFAVDHATNVDQTTIPRGGIVVPVAPVAPTPAPAPAPAPAATTTPASAAAPTPGKYIPPHLRKKTPGGSRRTRKRMTRKRK
jgi:8-oxo-dGTP pyrophosphatase MutT (NUDIX family)